MNVGGQNLDETSDPNITNAVQSQVGQSNNDVAHTYQQGVSSTAQGLLNAPQATGGAGPGMSYGNSALSTAINQRANQGYNLQMNELNSKVLRAADEDHIKNLSMATSAATQEVQENRQKALLAYQIDQQNKRARGAILGNVLGIIGTVGGAVAGGAMTGGTGTAAGAALGAQAGNALGQGAGNMIGGQ